MIMLLLSIFLIVSACEKEPMIDPPIQSVQDTLSGDITENRTLVSTKTYYLSGFVYVKNSTLTIEPGTIIKGVSGTKATLIIEKDSKIIAQGTNTKPIVFTSDKPKGQRSYGDWGGIVLCGNAPTNKQITQVFLNM